ncbi:MAG TPA: HipA family kinase [Chthoniobacter sp.]|jgi:hypothetical protein
MAAFEQKAARTAMEVLQLSAVGFVKGVTVGRNRPLLLSCEDGGGKAFEVVVKFRGREMDSRAQIAEIVCAQLADDLGLEVPRAAVVDVSAEFAEVVPDPAMAAQIQQSLGANFGSIHLGAGFTTWPSGKAPHGGQRDPAAMIFSFDTLVQNADRRSGNPNLWARSDRLGVYDHEQAFAFLYLPMIGGAKRPWVTADQATGFDFLKSHVFFASLRGTQFDLSSFEEKFGAMDDARIDAYFDCVPALWCDGNDLRDQIPAYLRDARKQRGAIVNFVKHLLR